MGASPLPKHSSRPKGVFRKWFASLRRETLALNLNDFEQILSFLSLSLFWKRKVTDWINTAVFNALSRFAVCVESTTYLCAGPRDGS